MDYPLPDNFDRSVTFWSAGRVATQGTFPRGLGIDVVSTLEYSRTHPLSAMGVYFDPIRPHVDLQQSIIKSQKEATANG